MPGGAARAPSVARALGRLAPSRERAPSPSRSGASLLEGGSLPPCPPPASRLQERRPPLPVTGSLSCPAGPTRTGPRRRRLPEPRFGSCLSPAVPWAAAAAGGGGWGCPGGAPSPQGERGAGAQRESRAARARPVCAHRAPPSPLPPPAPRWRHRPGAADRPAPPARPARPHSESADRGSSLPRKPPRALPPGPAMALRRLLLLLLLLSLESLDLLPGAHGARGRAANRTLSAGAAAVGGRRPGGALARGGRELNGTARAPGVPEAGSRRGQPAAAVAAASAAVTYETCWGYYDVSGQYDKEFECNNSESGYLYCCGTCYYRFCCKKRHEKLDQRQCNNYQSPVWVQTPSTKVVSPGPENKYDPEKDKTNFTVYITCGVIAFVIVAGVFAKVSYDKAHRPPREMNIHR